MGLMEGKICIVTGAAGSIGYSAASILLSEGGRVTLVDLDESALEGVKSELGSDSEQCITVAADVSQVEDTKRYIHQTVEKWGTFDVLFSNAGVAGAISPITEYPEEVFDNVIAVNVRASFLACKYGLPQMNDNGSIIITSSIMGVTADPGVCAYATSKHALIGLTRVVAKEAAERNIRANILAPGPVDNSFQLKIEEKLTEIVGQDGTEMLNGMIPLGRHARPDEIGKMVLFLASDQSSFSTGSVFNIDGGMNI